ncbi:MAG: acetyl-CoA carboxylase biotin carboxylase subunit [Betaproteobacteria bacterium RIFCSPLOWO2_12_FULL_62_13]|nr:MAG: acetyl-CoA carboxylase biotin carboxylase subunit [Betaproteobacteria bacterium RIFCSPLOWO2_12_FULL_62_13]
MTIKRVLIANRGEIAVRIARACRKLGVETVLACSEADRASLAARIADRVVCIGPAQAMQSYLDQDAVITSAIGTGCDALHPGYGFLSERASFRRLCDEAGVRFIGPHAEAIATMGDKLTALRLAKANGVPTIPGCNELKSARDAKTEARRTGLPVILKASAGGGGRGMRVVRAFREIDSAFASASAEAQAAFGDGTLYMEKYIKSARHIEVQVFGDTHGKIVHLGERDCSVQRRHQKLIEEAPSPVVDGPLRKSLTAAALRLAKAASYVGAGTVEFIVDLESRAYYFLEMNTRIQVEHPVTEEITGMDLVSEQIRVAAGEPLSFLQGDVTLSGHAIECRINAEEVDAGFMPCPGAIVEWQQPDAAGVRVDTHCYPGYAIPPFYDSMIGKLIVLGEDRREAIEKTLSALDRFVIGGVQTTLPFSRAIVADDDFRRSAVTTDWLEHVFLPRYLNDAEVRR